MKTSSLIESLLPVRHSVQAIDTCDRYDPIAQQSATLLPGRIVCPRQSDDGVKHSDADFKTTDTE